VAFENNFVVHVKLLIALDYTISDYLKIEIHIIILHTKCQGFFIVFFPRIGTHTHTYTKFFVKNFLMQNTKTKWFQI
jgi:hypothetical protein